MLVSNIKRNTSKKEQEFSLRYQNICTRIRELTDSLEIKEQHLTEAQVSRFNVPSNHK
jgi:hypothetical protein